MRKIVAPGNGGRRPYQHHLTAHRGPHGPDEAVDRPDARANSCIDDNTLSQIATRADTPAKVVAMRWLGSLRPSAFERRPSAAGQFIVCQSAEKAKKCTLRVIRGAPGNTGGGWGLRMLPCVTRVEAARAVWSLCYDVIGGLTWLHKAYGSAVAINSPLASRQASPIAYLFSGATLNEAVYDQMDRLRLKGVWPNPAPHGSSQEKLRFNYMSLGGSEHHHYARQISGQFGKPRAERLFDDMRAIIDEEVAAWPTARTVDLANLARELATRCALQMLYGESERERALKIGKMIDRYHAMNWSASVMSLRLNLPGLPYRKLIDTADNLYAELQRWTDDAGRLPSANLAVGIQRTHRSFRKPGAQFLQDRQYRHDGLGLLRAARHRHRLDADAARAASLDCRGAPGRA